MDKIIFTDFDGTITKNDTCDAMVEAFAKGDYESINNLWVDKKISTQECANSIFRMFDANIEDVDRLLDRIEIDDYFIEFLKLCRDYDYPVYVLSDGYDYNIRKIFKKNNIELPFYANKLSYDNGFSISCPHNNKDCGRCGTCKKGLLNRLKGNAAQVIYIGDGYSDTCPAACADIVFAKGTLYKYCISNRINVIHFDSFKDIMENNIFNAKRENVCNI